MNTHQAIWEWLQLARPAD